MLTFSLRQTAAVKSKKKHYVNLLGTDNWLIVSDCEIIIDFDALSLHYLAQRKHSVAVSRKCEIRARIVLESMPLVS